jgi:hypothetical protein
LSIITPPAVFARRWRVIRAILRMRVYRAGLFRTYRARNRKI